MLPLKPLIPMIAIDISGSKTQLKEIVRLEKSENTKSEKVKIHWVGHKFILVFFLFFSVRWL